VVHDYESYELFMLLSKLLEVEFIAYSLKLGALGPAAFVLIKVGGFRPGSLCAHTLKSHYAHFVVDWYHMHLHIKKFMMFKLSSCC
jgi:hypothetical protein